MAPPFVSALIASDSANRDCGHPGLGSRLPIPEWSTRSPPRSRLGERIGQLSGDDMIRLSRALVVFLGLAGT